ncbi:MAG: hypothetical protein H7Z43_00515 [Clostridia bacterium]|nr:hypothetical protein [Deltaproteobacteria bacterium]
MRGLILQGLTQLGLFALAVTLIAAYAHAVERWSGRIVSHHLGWNGVLVTGWLGVPLHEMAHLIFAKLFGHRIVGVAFFDPDPSTGTLGYVRHAYTKRTPWQLVGNAIIGMAPLLFGGLALLALLVWMIGLDDVTRVCHVSSRVVSDARDLRFIARDVTAVMQRLAFAVWRERTWWLPLQLYLGICVAAHYAPSRTDFAGAWQGMVTVALTVVAVVVGASALQFPLSIPVGLVVPMAAIAVIASIFQLLWVLVAKIFADLV